MTDREGLVRKMIDADPFARLLGVRLADVSDSGVVVEMDIGRPHMNFLQVMHGGVLFSLADVAFSLAGNAAGDRAVAIDTHLVLTAAVKEGDRLRAVAEEATRGRTLGSYRVVVTRGDGRVAGLFTGTVHISQSP